MVGVREQGRVISDTVVVASGVTANLERVRSLPRGRGVQSQGSGWHSLRKN